jgi:endonuclease/exonuclease/phosphatase family metal-dependent hydrolase
MRGGTFNLLYGRNPKVVQREVMELLSKFNLDYLGVQEATDYRLELHDIPGYAYYTGGSVNGGASTEIGILVKDIHDVSNVKNRAYGDGWWSAKVNGTRMQPRNFLVLTLNNKHKKAVVHFPPSVDLAKRTPTDRYEDSVLLSKRCRRFLSGPSFKTREIMGDWNNEPFIRARYSPSWIANQTGATVSSPDKRIDYILTKGLNVDNIKKVNMQEKSDHNPVVYYTKPKLRRHRKDN